jgi:hypothetical protein
MNYFKHFFILSALLFASLANAQDTESESLDFNLKLGNHTIFAPYYFSGDKVVQEGYLLTVADLALIKVEFDSFEDTLRTSLDSLAEECRSSLDQCQEDSDTRFTQIILDNENLKKTLELQLKLYEAQKFKTYAYTITAVIVTGATSFFLVKMAY